ncbi:nitrogen permease regulator of amino acid transport activity 3-domain-containing protein [Cladochytrium replicatum]|nr:nitrogen permease regulator of amino acid transport activity 3-domain-containing protein [Cladochytrium replicatum]
MDLVGILLISYSSRGRQLVFSYPEKHSPLPQFPLDPAQTNGHSTSPGRRPAPKLPPESRKSVAIPLSPSHKSVPLSTRFLGFDHQTLSDILTPKYTICDRHFQLTVDDTTFVGHPTLLNADRPGTGHKYTRLIQKRRVERDDSSDDIPLGGSMANLDGERGERNGPLAMFNLVFAFRPASKPEEGISLKVIYRTVIARVTAALKFEQGMRAYVREESELILGIKEEALNPEEPFDVTGRILECSSLARLMTDLYNSIHARQITHLLINNSISMSLNLTDLTETSALDQQSDYDPQHPQLPPYLQTDPAQQEVVRKAYPAMRPYHALLLLYDGEEILRTLTQDPSPLLVELIQIVSPTMSFEELRAALDCSLSQIYKLAAHLIYWKKAKIVDVVNARNMYVVNPDLDLSCLATLVPDAARLFPTVDIITLLSKLQQPTPFSTVLPSKDQQEMYLDILYFLLRQNIVVQQHFYIFLRIPDRIRRKTINLEQQQPETPMDSTPVSKHQYKYSTPTEYNDMIPNSPSGTLFAGQQSGDMSVMIANPGRRLSEIEELWVQNAAATAPEPIGANFRRCFYEEKREREQG